MSSQSRNNDQSCNDGNEERKRKRKREDTKVEDEFFNHLEVKSECKTKEIARRMSISAGESAENLHVETVESEKKLVPKLRSSIPGENLKKDTNGTKLEEPKFSAMESEQRSLPTSSLNEDLTQSTKAHHVRRVRTKSENEKLTDWIQNQQHEQIKASLNKDTSLRHSVDVLDRTLLHISAKYGNVTATDHILDIFDVDARDSNGRTALMLAVENNHVKVVEMLLSARSDIDAVDNEGKTVLHVGFAKDELKVGIVNHLLLELHKRCANTEAKATKLIDSRCPIYHAVRLRDVEVIKTMLDRGVDANATGPTKGTALHWAVILEEPEIVEVLLEKGADAEALDAFHSPPLPYNYTASNRAPGNRKKIAILELLLARKVLLTKPIRDGFFQVTSTLIFGCAEAIARLLRSGYLDFGAVDALSGSRPMHYLACNGNRGVAELLKLHAAQYDYHLNAINDRGGVPLLEAVKGCNVEMVQFLLEQGADANHAVSVFGCRGLTPMYFCFMHNRVAFVRECLEVLLQHKANPQAVLTEANGNVRTLLDDVHSWRIRLKPIVAHLVLIERQGEVVAELIRKKIRSSVGLQRYYQRCQAILDEKLFGSVTIWKLLIHSDKKVMNYLNNGELRLKLKKLNKKLRIHDSYWYYYNVLRKRVVKLLRLRELRDKAAGTVCKLFANTIDEKHIITENVLDFLDALSLEQLILM